MNIITCIQNTTTTTKAKNKNKKKLWKLISQKISSKIRLNFKTSKGAPHRTAPHTAIPTHGENLWKIVDEEKQSSEMGKRGGGIVWDNCFHLQAENKKKTKKKNKSKNILKIYQCHVLDSHNMFIVIVVVVVLYKKKKRKS